MSKKAQTFSVHTLALIILTVMSIALIFAGFEGWFSDIVDRFVETVVLPDLE